MAKMIILNENEDILDEIFSKEIVIFEDIQGSKIYVNWDGENFTIKPKSLNAEPINIVDLALQRYYNKAINFLYSLDDRIKSLLPKNWYFCFEYFPDNQPANIDYDYTPKNNLILTGIYKGKKFNYSVDELREYSKLISTDYLPIMFKGKLNEPQIEAVKYFINTSVVDLEYVFGENNFGFFFYKLLNPKCDSSFLMKDDFQDNIEKLIVRIDGKDKSFQILNPLYERISGANNTEFTEIYSLLLVNFLDYCQLIDLDAIPVSGDKRDIMYINLISRLYNMYILETEEDIDTFEFTIPKFFNKDKFKINTELIENKLTKSHIADNPKLEYIFKVILGSFNKERKKPIGLFTDKTLELFNIFVNKLNKKIDHALGKLHEDELSQNGLLDFDKYYNIKYDVDGSGDVYPDVYDEFEAPSDKKKKGMDKKDDDTFGVDEDDIEDIKKRDGGFL